MGIAIILVIAYHCVLRIPMPITPLHYGFIGVDIFMFLSGYGLCYAYEKWDIKTFYTRRLQRVYPLFLFLAIVKYGFKYFFDAVTNIKWGIVQFLSTISTYSYYRPDTGIFVDWYVSSIILLYLLFPVLYGFISKTKIIGVSVILLLSAIFTLLFDFNWSYECFIGRIPIFCLGILLFEYKNQITNRSIITITLLLSIMAMVNTALLHNNRFLTTALLSPALILSLLIILEKIHFWKNVKEIGKVSFELYISNCILLIFLKKLEISTSMDVILYLLIYVILSILLFVIVRHLNLIFIKVTGCYKSK